MILKENLPIELAQSKRFFPVTIINGKKVPALKAWQKPENQMSLAQVEGLVGFDTTGHGQSEDYILFDFDHVLDDSGCFVNDEAANFFADIQSLFSGYYCELSISGRGLHILAKPSPDTFSTISNNEKGTLFFGNGDAKLEIFYRQSARYCLMTGKVFKCNPQSPIPSGRLVDDVLEVILGQIEKQNKALGINLTENSTTPDKNSIQSVNPDYDRFRAGIMLDCIEPEKLTDANWLVVNSAAKHIGLSYDVIDAFNRRDPKRYDEHENKVRWDSLRNPSFGIRHLHSIAKRFGYVEKTLGTNGMNPCLSA